MPALCVSLWPFELWERSFLEDILTGSKLRVEIKKWFSKQDNDRQFEKISEFAEKKISRKPKKIANYEV